MLVLVLFGRLVQLINIPVGIEIWRGCGSYRSVEIYAIVRIAVLKNIVPSEVFTNKCFYCLIK